HVALDDEADAAERCLLGVGVLGGDQLADPVGEILVVSHRDNHGAGPETPIIGLRLLALAAGLRHHAGIGQPGLCVSAPTATPAAVRFRVSSCFLASARFR